MCTGAMPCRSTRCSFRVLGDAAVEWELGLGLRTEREIINQLGLRGGWTEELLLHDSRLEAHRHKVAQCWLPARGKGWLAESEVQASLDAGKCGQMRRGCPQFFGCCA